MRIGGGRRSSNVEDRRGQQAAGGAIGGAGAMLLARFLFSRTGRRFILPLAALVAIGFFVFPQQTQALLGMLFAGPSQAPASGPVAGSPEEEATKLFAEQVLATTEEVWGAVYAERGTDYPEPKLVFYRGGTRTACGFGQAAMGPFYCPPDQTVYIDLTFFEDMERRMRAGGDFAQAYVIAHEVGHHVQNLTGVLEWSMQERQRLGGQTPAANQVSVRTELMADCLAGVWANRARRLTDVEIERGDLEEAIGAAKAVGDDTLQRNSGRPVTPENFSHGSAAQRVAWFQRGFTSGDWTTCDTRNVPAAQL